MVKIKVDTRWFNREQEQNRGFKLGFRPNGSVVFRFSCFSARMFSRTTRLRFMLVLFKMASLYSGGFQRFQPPRFGRLSLCD